MAREARPSSGVCGHVPPENFGILVMLRSHLEQFGGNTARVNCMLVLTAKVSEQLYMHAT